MVRDGAVLGTQRCSPHTSTHHDRARATHTTPSATQHAICNTVRRRSDCASMHIAMCISEQLRTIDAPFTHASIDEQKKSRYNISSEMRHRMPQTAEPPFARALSMARRRHARRRATVRYRHSNATQRNSRTATKPVPCGLRSAPTLQLRRLRRFHLQRSHIRSGPQRRVHSRLQQARRFTTSFQLRRQTPAPLIADTQQSQTTRKVPCCTAVAGANRLYSSRRIMRRQSFAARMFARLARGRRPTSAARKPMNSRLRR